MKAEVGQSFRPQQGLTIMNKMNSAQKVSLEDSFRPQQGLTIMNRQNFKNGRCRLLFVSVPNRG